MVNESPGMRGGERGVALIIVLLVTALLIALVFEFAYGTRISLRGAVNFRDSERAYYLARSGVNGVGRLLSFNLQPPSKPQENLEQRDWIIPPLPVAADTELRVRWEDEGGKISISSVFKENDAYKRLIKLFDIRGIDQRVLDEIAEDRKSFYLLTELHQYLSDEDFNKVKDDLTVMPFTKIDINTASAEVLQSLGLSAGMAGIVEEHRKQEPFATNGEIADVLQDEYSKIAGGANLTYTSDIFKVDAAATVGGYTKQVEAIITRSSSGFTVNYWRAL